MKCLRRFSNQTLLKIATSCNVLFIVTFASSSMIHNHSSRFLIDIYVWLFFIFHVFAFLSIYEIVDRHKK